MDGILHVLNELGLAVQSLKQMLAERDARIAELEAALASKDEGAEGR